MGQGAIYNPRPMNDELRAMLSNRYARIRDIQLRELNIVREHYMRTNLETHKFELLDDAGFNLIRGTLLELTGFVEMAFQEIIKDEYGVVVRSLHRQIQFLAKHGRLIDPVALARVKSSRNLVAHVAAFAITDSQLIEFQLIVDREMTHLL
jgi:hypothetical protein